MPPRRPPAVRAAVIATIALASLLTVSATDAPNAAAEPQYYCDVDGDSLSDLLVGVPLEDAERRGNVGAMHEFLSQPGQGLTASSSWVRAIGAAAGQRFGETIVCADFNADGYADVAVGAPFDDTIRDPGSVRNAGLVVVFFGGPAGLQSGMPVQLITQDSPGIAERSEVDDVFGFDLTYCYFDNDEYADLAIGVPGERVNGVDGAGAVHVIYGGPTGLSRRDQIIRQGKRGIGDVAEPFDYFGEFLTATDVDGDGACDLVVGVPSEDIGSKTDAGAVHVIFSDGRTGLGSRDQLIHRDSPDVSASATPYERFGAPLFFGDFKTDSLGSEVVVGVPGQDSSGKVDAGAVHILNSDSQGLTGRGDLIVTQDSPGIRGRTNAHDQFGRSVITGYFNGDSLMDLAVGVPGERVGGRAAAGAVQIIFGNGAGLSRRDLLITQATLGATSERGDFFGATLAAGDFNDDGRTDIAVGAPYEDLVHDVTGRRVVDAGAVNTILGGARGLRGAGSQLLVQDLFPPDQSVTATEPCDSFGNFTTGIGLPVPRGVVANRCDRSGRSLQEIFDPVPGAAEEP